MASKATDAPREWFRIRAQAEDPTVAEIDIFDFIGDWIDGYWGFGITAKQFLDQLAKLPDSIQTIKLRVNSPGGDFYSGTAIANLLRDQQASKGRTVKILIDGLAASAATIVTSAGTKGQVAMADNAVMFVHHPWTFGVGNAKELRRMAEDLDKLSGSIITAYQWRSPLAEEELRGLMDADTLMNADEAIAHGLADEKIAGLPAMAAAFDPRGLAAMQKAPEAFRAKIQAMTATVAAPEPAEPETPPAEPVEAPASAAEVLTAVEAAGFGPGLARQLVEAGLPLAGVTARIAEAKEVRGLCATAKLPELADSYIEHRVPIAGVRAQLAMIVAKRDGVEIRTALPPDGGDRALAPSRLNPSAIYAERAARAGQRGA
jgi:ATP-dependent protease ClpP protease subunit